MPDDRPAPSARSILDRRRVSAAGLDFTFATEDISRPADWGFEEPRHTFVVHLEGRLRSLECAFSRGPSGAMLPARDDIWMIPAGCRYAAQAHGRRVSFAEVAVGTEVLGGVELPARVAHRDGFLAGAMRRAAAVAGREDDIGRMLFQALAEAVRLHLCDAYGARPGARPDRQLSQADRERLAAWVRERLDQPLSLPAMAAQAQMGVHDFLAAFRAAFGVTPWQYVIQARLDEARRLLRETDLPVTAIALTAGFASPSHFAAAFRRRIGASPTAYRVEASGRT